MPLFEVSTISVFRHKYVIEAKNLEHAYDTVLIDNPESLTQKYLDENIIDGRKIGRKEFERICEESMKDGAELSNGHLGTRIIHKVNYNES
jgi:hypothetical protein